MKKIRRSILLIDRPFQIKYALFLALSGGLIALFFGAHIFYFLREYLRVFVPNYEANPTALNFLISEQRNVLIYLVLTSTLIMSLLFFIGIVVTHRIAGPVMVVRKKIKDIAGGNSPVKITLRKGDEFRELADALNDLSDSINRNKSANNQVHSSVNEDTNVIKKKIVKKRNNNK